MMKHADFVQAQAVERYLLGEMNREERDVFEEHYFDCRICADDVVEGTRLMVAGRRVAREDEARKVVPIRTRWVPLAAAASLTCALLGGGAGYELARMAPSNASEPRLLPVAVALQQSRGDDAQPLPRVPRNGAVKFAIFGSDECPAVKYVATIRGTGVEKTVEVSQERAADEVHMTIGELPAGRYELLIEGVRKDGNRCEVSRDPFMVEER